MNVEHISVRVQCVPPVNPRLPPRNYFWLELFSLVLRFIVCEQTGSNFKGIKHERTSSQEARPPFDELRVVTQ